MATKFETKMAITQLVIIIITSDVKAGGLHGDCAGMRR